MAPSGSLRRADAVAPQNLKMVQSLLPMLHRLPFRNHVLQRQIEQLQRRFLAGKRTTVLNDLPQTPMQRFHGVGGIDHLPYFGRKRKERNHSLPVLLPQLADRSVFVTPLTDKAVQFPLRFRRRRCPVDGFQIRHYLLPFFPVHIIQTGPHQVHDCSPGSAHNCTCANGNTASIACGNPFSPCTHTMNMSFTPRFFNSVSTDSQNLAPSLALVHSPSTSLCPSKSTPMATYTARFSTRPSCRIFTYRASRYTIPYTASSARFCHTLTSSITASLTCEINPALT